MGDAVCLADLHSSPSSHSSEVENVLSAGLRASVIQSSEGRACSISDIGQTDKWNHFTDTTNDHHLKREQNQYSLQIDRQVALDPEEVLGSSVTSYVLEIPKRLLVERLQGGISKAINKDG